jgi:hypothetical protein
LFTNESKTMVLKLKDTKWVLSLNLLKRT